MYLLRTYAFKCEIFFLSLEAYSVYYLNEKQAMRACFCLVTGLNKFFHTSAQMGFTYIECVLEEV